MTLNARWLDEEQTSVLVLEGTDPEVNPRAGARLVVALEEDGTWRGFAVTEAQPIVGFPSSSPDREHAKKTLCSAVLKSLHEDAARPGHPELLTFQPLIEFAAHELGADTSSHARAST